LASVDVCKARTYIRGACAECARNSEKDLQMKFTSEDAYLAHQAGDPILLGPAAVARILRQHDADLADFQADCGCTEQTDAWELLGWLGY